MMMKVHPIILHHQGKRPHARRLPYAPQGCFQILLSVISHTHFTLSFEAFSPAGTIEIISFNTHFQSLVCTRSQQRAAELCSILSCQLALTSSPWLCRSMQGLQTSVLTEMTRPMSLCCFTLLSPNIPEKLTPVRAVDVVHRGAHSLTSVEKQTTVANGFSFLNPIPLVEWRACNRINLPSYIGSACGTVLQIQGAAFTTNVHTLIRRFSINFYFALVVLLVQLTFMSFFLIWALNQLMNYDLVNAECLKVLVIRKRLCLWHLLHIFFLGREILWSAVDKQCYLIFLQFKCVVIFQEIKTECNKRQNMTATIHIYINIYEHIHMHI